MTDETTGPEPILILSSKNKGVTFGGAASAAKSRVLSPATTTSGSEYASSDETTRSKNSATMQSSQSLSSAESLSSADETVCRGSGGAGSDSKQNTPVNGTRRTDVRSPITAIKTAIRSRGSPNKSAKNSPAGPSRAESPSTRGGRLMEDSPSRHKTIPNFGGLNVKQKASAYEQHVTNKARNEGLGATTELLRPPRVTRSSVARKSDEPLAVPLNDVSSNRDSSSVTRTSSLRRSSRVSGVKSGIRLSMSKRRSSIMRHHLRTSQNLAKHTKEIVNESLRHTPGKQPVSISLCFLVICFAVLFTNA